MDDKLNVNETGNDKMTTVCWDMKSEIIAEHTDNDPLQLALEEAAALLQRGDIVAFPTETVYGLGANARMTEAVEAVFRAKGRPSDNPLIVHIADVKQLDEMVVSVDNTSRRLMEAFWPGPLTLVLPVKPDVLSPRVTAGLDTVAIRMPDHPIALRLIARANCPVAAPSANRSGRPSPTLASHVLEDLEGHIAGIVDGGATGWRRIYRSSGTTEWICSGAPTWRYYTRTTEKCSGCGYSNRPGYYGCSTWRESSSTITGHEIYALCTQRKVNSRTGRFSFGGSRFDYESLKGSDQ